MKKRVLFIFLSLFFLLLFPVIAAQANSSTQINNGFSCLNSRISSNCSSLSLGEKIFSSLATGQCINQIESSEASNGCFPSGSCDIKTTSQALLSLKNSGRSTNKSATWLLSQVIPTSNLDWFLQIDSNAPTSCTVSYSGTPYAFEINDDKTISGGTTNCLSISQSGYWLLISPSCYGTQFSISCDAPFKTTELYQRQGYPTIYVSSSSNSASSGGTVTNSVNSSCFGGTSCNYEASLWAALALDYLGKDISSFIPYLIVMADDAQNQQYLPYSFLYSLTSSSDFLNKLLSQQKTVNNKNYWDAKSVSGPYYDTALALLPLKLQTSPEKTSALDWLFSVQGSDGCWNSDNILDTAFILYSVAGSRATIPSTSTSCTAAGYYCLSSNACNQSGGNVLSGYTCSAGTYSCCSQPLATPTCSAQGGTICASGQICQGGSSVPASDASSSQICCLSGSCAVQQQTTNDCELAQGTCRSSCLDNEQALGQSCSLSSESCCIAKSGGAGTIWIWILGILIFLTVLGIIFRKKLRVLWLRIKSKFNKGGAGQSQQGPRGPPPFRPQPQMSFQRRPMPPPQQRSQQKPTEVNDVLKRLKDIGK